MIGPLTWKSSQLERRQKMSTITNAVTKSITAMWKLAVRRACVPFCVDLSQSQKPVRAVGTDTIAPAIRT